LHHEEFTQPRLLPAALVRSYRTVSPITDFLSEMSDLKNHALRRDRLDSSLLHLSSPGIIPGARTLSGSLLSGVRTFLRSLSKPATARLASLARLKHLNKKCSTITIMVFSFIPNFSGFPRRIFRWQGRAFERPC
jgi:hypothetical protein